MRIYAYMHYIQKEHGHINVPANVWPYPQDVLRLDIKNLLHLFWDFIWVCTLQVNLSRIPSPMWNTNLPQATLVHCKVRPNNNNNDNKIQYLG